MIATKAPLVAMIVDRKGAGSVATPHGISVEVCKRSRRRASAGGEPVTPAPRWPAGRPRARPGDTCVWLDLAKSINGEQLIAVYRGLIHQEQLELLVPQIVIDEFERNRGRIEADMARSVTATFHQVRAAVDEHGQGDGREETLKQLDDLTHRVPLINQMAIRQFSEILELLQGGRRLDPSDEVHRRAVDRALTKRAPSIAPRTASPMLSSSRCTARCSPPTWPAQMTTASSRQISKTSRWEPATAACPTPTSPSTSPTPGRTTSQVWPPQ